MDKELHRSRQIDLSIRTLPKRLAIATVGVVFLAAELNAAANSSSFAPKTENKQPCVEPTPNAILIPLARPGDDRIELIPLAPARKGTEITPTITEPNTPTCPTVIEI